MKRIISLLLCLVMCVSFFSTTASAVVAAEEIDKIITVSASEFKDEAITFTVSLAPNQEAVAGVVVYMEYDPAVLQVQECVETGKVSGIYTFGAKYDDPNVYCAAFATEGGIDVDSTAKTLYTITFKVISENRPMANVKFKCVEYQTTDGVDNDINKNDSPVLMGSFDFRTISAPQMVSACSSVTGIVAEWESVVGATGYDVYRMAEDETDWSLICENHNGTSYEDNTIDLGTEYSYCVAARNEYGAGQKSANPVLTMNFGAIETFTAVHTYTGASLKWSALDGAASYDVYRKKVTDSSWKKLANTTGTSYEDNTIESYVEYNYKVEAIKGVYRAGIACDIPVVKYLAAPEASVTNTEEGIEVYFSAVNGAEKYIVEKLVGGNYVVVYTGAEGDSVYVDTSVAVNESATYRVYVTTVDRESAIVDCSAITRLGTPNVKTVSSTKAGAKVTWTAVDGATEYAVYRAVYGTDDYKLVGTASGTTFTDGSANSGVVYTYTVSATNDTGCGPKDDGVTELYLAAPELKSRKNVIGGVEISWRPVEGATGYKVYRKTGSSGWKIVGLYSANTTTFTDKGVNAKGEKIGMKNNTTYKYTVRATNDNRDDFGITYPGGYDKSVTSGYDTTGLAIKYIITPTLSKTSNTTKGIKITWKKVTGAKKYRIYRRLSTTSYWTRITDTASTSYVDTSVKNASGKTYYYTVEAINGTYSSARNKTGIKLRRLSNPTLVSAKSAKAGITVKWKKVTGCTGYYVYRKTAKTGYKRIAIVKGISKLSYLDKSAKKGTTYTYTVRARYGSTLSYYNTGLSCKDKY